MAKNVYLTKHIPIILLSFHFATAREDSFFGINLPLRA